MTALSTTPIERMDRAAPLFRLDDWSDRLSPVVVREVRQAFKSRGFVVVFHLLLFACWAVSLAGLALAGPGLEFGRPGMTFFAVYFLACCFAVGIVIPLQAFESVWAERRDGTLEMLTVTSLPTGRIVNGKFIAAMTKGWLVAAAVGPFVAFSALLPGFSPLGVVWAAGMATAFASASWLAGIGLGALGRGPLAASILRFLLTGGLAIFWLIASLILVGTAGSPAINRSPDFWGWSCAWVVFAGLAAVVFKAMADTQLNRDASGRYRDLHPNTPSSRGLGGPGGHAPLPGMAPATGATR